MNKALLALAVGRQTAGRVTPAGWAMREADFEVLLRLGERLRGEEGGAGGGGAGGARGGPGGGLGRARGGAAAGGGVRRRPALPALRGDDVAALGVRQRAAAL